MSIARSLVTCTLKLFLAFMPLTATSAEVTSLAGEWMVLSKVVDGESDTTKNMFGIFSDIDSVFSLYSNGRGKFQDVTLRWSFDTSSRRFSIERPRGFSFGMVEEIGNATAERIGDVVVLSGLHTYSNGRTESLEITIVPVNLKKFVGASVLLEPKTFDKEFFVEEFETSFGVPKKVTLRRDFETSFSTTNTNGTEKGAQVKVGIDSASLSAGLKMKIETSVGTTIGTRDTFEESYELDGREHVKLIVKWIKRFRKGEVVLPSGERRPFEVFVGL
ncbi:MAG: hypothetical protein WAT12_00070 [Candidatus Nitrotoga sp.]